MTVHAVRPVVLVVLDGLGVRDDPGDNAVVGRRSQAGRCGADWPTGRTRTRESSQTLPTARSRPRRSHTVSSAAA